VDGNLAVYSINVTGADDVAAGLKFAQEKNIRLVVKNTGHEYVDPETQFANIFVLTEVSQFPWTFHRQGFPGTVDTQSQGDQAPQL
jgi:hypothetical protein